MYWYRLQIKWEIKIKTLSNAEVKNGGALPPLPPHVFMA
jgi:hypothetical protein